MTNCYNFVFYLKTLQHSGKLVGRLVGTFVRKAVFRMFFYKYFKKFFSISGDYHEISLDPRSIFFVHKKVVFVFSI